MEILLLALIALGIATAAKLTSPSEAAPPIEKGYALVFLWKDGVMTKEQLADLRYRCSLDEEVISTLERATVCRLIPIEKHEVVWAPVRSRATSLQEDEVWIALVLDPDERVEPIDLWPSIRRATGSTVPLRMQFGAIGGARFLEAPARIEGNV